MQAQYLLALIYIMKKLKAGNYSEKPKNEISQLLYSLYISKKKKKKQKNLQQLDQHYLNMEKIYINTENSKTNESNKFIYQFTDKLILKPQQQKDGLVNLSIYYTQKNIKSAYNTNKFKVSIPTWNHKFDLPDRSYSISEIQNYLEFIIKKHKRLTENPLVQIYHSKIKNRIVFKVGYKLELLSPETMKLL